MQNEEKFDFPKLFAQYILLPDVMNVNLKTIGNE